MVPLSPSDLLTSTPLSARVRLIRPGPTGTARSGAGFVQDFALRAPIAWLFVQAGHPVNAPSDGSATSGACTGNGGRIPFVPTGAACIHRDITKDAPARRGHHILPDVGRLHTLHITCRHIPPQGIARSPGPEHCSVAPDGTSASTPRRLERLGTTDAIDSIRDRPLGCLLAAPRRCGGWWRTASRLQMERSRVSRPTTSLRTHVSVQLVSLTTEWAILRQSSADDFNREECQATDHACVYGGGLRFQVARLRSTAQPCTVGRTVDLTD